MKKFGGILVGVLLCFTFIWVLASCSGSKVSKAYADSINKGAADANYVTFETVKKDLGKECNDWTFDGSGYIFAVRGYDNLDNQEAFMKLTTEGDENTKYQILIVLCTDNNCVNAQYFEGTGAELTAKLEEAIKL